MATAAKGVPAKDGDPDGGDGGLALPEAAGGTAPAQSVAPAEAETSAEDSAGPLSRLTFLWVAPFVREAYAEICAGAFELASLPALPSDQRVDKAIEGLAVELRIERAEAAAGDSAASSKQRRTGSCCCCGRRRRRGPSLHAALWRWQRARLIFETFRACLFALLFVASPLLLRYAVRAMRSDAPLAEGYAAVAAMALLGLLGGVLQQWSFHAFVRFGREIWCGLVGNIFEQLAVIEPAKLGVTFTEGQILSLIGQDAAIFPYMTLFFGTFLAMPLNICLPAAVLLYFLREAFVVGFSVCILIVLIGFWAASEYKRLVAQKLKVADQRLVIINEALQGIRSVKLCAWEAAIEARVAAVREREMRLLWRIHACYALQQGAVSALPVLGVAAALLTHVSLDRPLEADVVAMTIGYFDLMALGFLLLPNCKMQLEVMSAGITRIERFLLCPDSSLSASARPTANAGDAVPGATKPVAGLAKDDTGIELVGASFRWRIAEEDVGFSEDQDVKAIAKDLKGEEPAARAAAAEPVKSETPQAAVAELSLCVRRGELLAVVGRVASGKSTLAAGVLGLAPLAGGQLRLNGRAAYVPQGPQILNASVRENILFGSVLDEKRYHETLSVCCLESDLDQLADGDETEIGEKGITISGGQRARVALARAYYADADVVVLDDPLSAMDAHVGAKVFKRCILGLRRQGRAVLFMTNQLHFCKDADEIMVLEAGRLSERGTFAKLSAPGGGGGGGGGHFAGLLHAAEAAAAAADAEANGTGGSTGGADGHEAGETEEGRGEEGKAGDGADDETNADDEEGAPDGAAGAAALGPSAAAVGVRRRTSGAGMTKEVALQGRVGLREWRRLARSGRASRLGAALGCCCVAVVVLMYLTNVFLGLWTDAVEGRARRDDESGPAFDGEVVLYLATGIAYAGCCMLRVSAAATYFSRVAKRLHARMLASVLRQPLTWYDTTPLGRVLNRFSQDVALTDLQVPRIFEFTAQHCTVVLIGVVGAGFLAWPALIVMLLVAPILRRIQNRYAVVALDLQRVMLIATSPVMSHTSGFLNALDTIRAFGRERLFASRFRVVMTDFIRTYYWIHATDRLAMSLFTLLCIPVLTLLLGLVVIPLARAGFLSPGLGGLALSLSSGLAQRLPLFLWVSSTLEKFFGGAQRVAEYADLPWEGGPADHAAWSAAAAVADSAGNGGLGQVAAELEEPAEQSAGNAQVPVLELEDVHLRYQPELPLVLRGLSLKVWPGEKLGVCGRTGSGKSTLFLACFRMVEPESGCVRFVGRDVKSLPLPSLRSQLAIVPQDPLMFSGTLRSNLDFHGRHGDDELWTALRLARLEEQVRELPLGLDEPVQEKGGNFSGGTVQLLCIARILLGRQRVIFLDECTASVDLRTDRAVQEAVRTALQGRAVVCIAHRLLTIVDYDRIACLDAGRVAEAASAHELLQRDEGLFAQLVGSMDKASATDIRRRAAAAFAASAASAASASAAASAASAAGGPALDPHADYSL